MNRPGMKDYDYMTVYVAVVEYVNPSNNGHYYTTIPVAARSKPDAKRAIELHMGISEMSPSGARRFKPESVVIVIKEAALDGHSEIVTCKY